MNLLFRTGKLLEWNSCQVDYQRFDYKISVRVSVECVNYYFRWILTKLQLRQLLEN